MTLRRREFLVGAGVAWGLGHPHFAIADPPSALQPKIAIRKDGTVLRNGKATFPLGMYHTSWVKDRMGEELRKDVRTIAQGGFNLVHPTLDLGPDGAKLLEVCDKENVGVIPEVNAAILTKVIERYRSAPALVAWNLGDDVTEKARPDELARLHKQVKALDPDRLTYVSAFNSGEKWLGKPGADAWLKSGVDLVGMQCYPIPWDREHGQHGGFDYAPGPHAKSNFRARVYYGMRRTVDQAQAIGHKGVIANLQCFKWNRTGEQWRWPTPGELENMTYQAVVAGVNGILYYAFYDASTFLPDNAPLFSRAKQLASEIGQLAQPLLAGKRTLLPLVEQQNDMVFSACWEHDKSVYVIVVNTSESETPEQVKAPLPVAVRGPLVSVFAEKPTGLSIRENHVVGEIGHGSVHVYKAANA